MQIRNWLIAIWLIAASAAAGGEIPVAEPEAVGMSSDRLLRIDTAMHRHIEAGNIQGAVTAVARRGKVVHFKAYGLMNVEKETPMSKDALFVMMSSTKPILGVAAMMMIEEGLIRPNDPVSDYIPEFAEMQVAVLKEPVDQNISPFSFDRQNPPEHRLVPAQSPITIEHLLTHTSGLGSGGLGSMQSQPRQRESLASYIPTLGTSILDFQPGSRWTYSGGTGLDVVARIVEIVSGVPFNEFVQTRIFDPLDMKDTHYNVPASKVERRVVIQSRDMSRFNRKTSYFSGSFGLSSTARDYLHFEQMLANGGELFGNLLLGSRSVEMFASNHVGDLFQGFTQNARGQGFGYTVAVVLDPIAANSRRSAGAFGWGGAFGTRSWTDPAEELTGVLMLQQSHAGAQYDFENAVRQAIVD